MYAFFSIIDLVFQIYIYALIANVAFSWLYAFNIINLHNHFVHTVGNCLYQITEPILRLVRCILPNLGTVDISPIIVFLIISFARSFMWNTIFPMFS